MNFMRLINAKIKEYFYFCVVPEYIGLKYFLLSLAYKFKIKKVSKIIGVLDLNKFPLGSTGDVFLFLCNLKILQKKYSTDELQINFIGPLTKHPKWKLMESLFILFKVKNLTQIKSLNDVIGEGLYLFPNKRGQSISDYQQWIPFLSKNNLLAISDLNPIYLNQAVQLIKKTSEGRIPLVLQIRITANETYQRLLDYLKNPKKFTDYGNTKRFTHFVERHTKFSQRDDDLVSIFEFLSWNDQEKKFQVYVICEKREIINQFRLPTVTFTKEHDFNYGLDCALIVVARRSILSSGPAVVPWFFGGRSLYQEIIKDYNSSKKSLRNKLYNDDYLIFNLLTTSLFKNRIRLLSVVESSKYLHKLNMLKTVKSFFLHE